MGLVLVAVAMAAQTPTVEITKHDIKTAKPMSEYMQQVGLLYLETAENLEKLDESGQPPDYWRKEMDGLENRIQITLNKPPRPAGDALYYELLRSARYAREALIQADKSQSKLWVQAWAACDAYGTTSATEGTFIKAQADDCDAKIKAATAQNEVTAETQQQPAADPAKMQALADKFNAKVKNTWLMVSDGTNIGGSKDALRQAGFTAVVFSGGKIVDLVTGTEN
jgi:hypothetical protein